jgi:hypothetical protein
MGIFAEFNYDESTIFLDISKITSFQEIVESNFDSQTGTYIKSQKINVVLSGGESYGITETKNDFIGILTKAGSTANLDYSVISK